MAQTGVGLGLPPSSQALIEQKLRLEGQLKGAAGWFFVIAGLSVINSLIVLFGGSWRFFLALGITAAFDGTAARLHSPVAHVAAFVINIIILCVPVMLGIFARQGRKWAFIVGMFLYGMDAVLMVLFQAWLGALFHVYVLFMMYRGITAVGMLEQIRQASLASTPAPIQP